MAKTSRFEMRMDAELLGRARELAAEAGISVAQLIQDVLAWAVENAHVGEPFSDVRGLIETAEADSMWFGRDGYDEDEDGKPLMNGHVVFVLDFSTGRGIRDGAGYVS